VRAGLLRAETVTRHHHVVVALPGDLPPVSVDAASVTEVIYILLDNASKYAPRGTTIRLRASTHGDERHVEVGVTDEGPGIPADQRERVFEKFYRVPARESHDPRRGGVGLGLPIARRLVEAQGGRIWIEGAPAGKGTVAAFVLPIAVETVESDRQPVAIAAAVK
jgi:two-component system sensor histidine kinase KdpD